MPANDSSPRANPSVFEAFVREALAADSDIDAGEEAYRADEVHTWLEQLALNHSGALPKPIDNNLSP